MNSKYGRTLTEELLGDVEELERAKHQLETDGVVPLDEIFGLVGRGYDFRALDNKYNKHNKTYVDRPSP